MQHDPSDATDRIEKLGRAITQRLTLSVIYNGANLSIEPYILLVRNDALYLGAYNPGKSRRHDAVPSLGLYNISGFSDIELGHEFTPLEEVPIDAPRGSDRVIHSLVR